MLVLAFPVLCVDACIPVRVLRVFRRGKIHTWYLPPKLSDRAEAMPRHTMHARASMIRSVTQSDWHACHLHSIASHRVASHRSLLLLVPCHPVFCAAVTAAPPGTVAPPTSIRLKNESSLFSMTVRELTTQFRLLLTGTPLQASVLFSAIGSTVHMI